MRSVMRHDFSRVPRANIPRSNFKRNHGCKTTFDAGYLIPIYLDEALPGDTFNLKLSAFARLTTPITPIMDNLFLEVQFFAVPIRLLWTNWEKFNGAQDDPGDSTAYTIPQIPTSSTTSNTFEQGSLSDYFGLPTKIQNLSVSSLWHRAYNLIWNEWYRDENLQDSVVVDVDDGPDDLDDYVLLRRGKRHDYFTSCLPWPQKGDAVELPLGTQAKVKCDQFAGGTDLEDKFFVANGLSGADQIAASATWNAASTDALDVGDSINLYADLTNATAATINDIREAFQLQKLYERDARGGTRYTEIIRSHFGVTSPDFRLQRPEYLGGGGTRINITPVAQTSSTDVTTPQGNLAAYGTGAMTGVGFYKSFTEHCVLLGLANVRADLTYQYGIPRMFARSDRFDYYWPALSHIGEQGVLMEEIYAVDGTTDTDTDGTPDNKEVWGYQERYAEYRYKPSQVTGLFRSNATGTLDSWHLSEKLTVAPALDSSYIQSDPPIDRVQAVATEPHIYFDSYFDLTCVRPMPTYAVPGMMDHF